VNADQQLEKVRKHSDTVRQVLLCLLEDDGQWAKIVRDADRLLVEKEAEFGDASFHRTVDELYDEMRQELVDARNWGGMMLTAQEKDGGN